MSKPPYFVLAPMDDVTDTVFRQIVADNAKPDLFFTEFVNVDGLCSAGRPRLLKKLKFTSLEEPLMVQLWGKTPESYRKIARQIADGSLAAEANGETGRNYVGIDINMGCPEKNIVSNGCCCALINNRDLAVEIIQAVKEGSRGALPISVKTRLGFNEIDLTWHELLLEQDLDALTIHARTRKEMSKVPAHWEVFSQIIDLRDEISPKTEIIGNGDIKSRQQGVKLAQKYKLDGIMIGRGIFDDPFVFAHTSNWEIMTKEERIELFKKHVELFAATWADGERDIHTLNKFCKIYISNFDGAKEMREKLMPCNSTDEILEILG